MPVTIMCLACARTCRPDATQTGTRGTTRTRGSIELMFFIRSGPRWNGKNAVTS